MNIESPPRRRLRLLMVAAASLSAVVTVAVPANAEPTSGEIRRAGTATVVANSYVVVLKDSVGKEKVAAKSGELSASFGGATGHVFRDALRGFEVALPEAAAKRLAADPSVAYVQENGILSVASPGTQLSPPSWGLNRIDQRTLPLDNLYVFPTRATSVKAYVLDTGINFSHEDFGGRVVSGIDVIDGGLATDANGHGTHVAGTIGGNRYGVAKNVSLVAVRVLDAFGNGSFAGVIAGIDWVTADHKAGQMAVANMSLGGGANDAVDTAVRNSIADGIVYGVAAGNNRGSACNFSPARVSEAITVGATRIDDAQYLLSNSGSCLDIFAPGEGITSAWIGSNAATRTITGTSMAAPHVVGAAALVLAWFPLFTPAEVRDFLVSRATRNKVTGVGAGSPNRLLYVENLLPAAFGISAPRLISPRVVDGGGVLITFTDTANNEDGFSLHRANGGPGGGGLVTDIATADKLGTGRTYFVVDTNPVQGMPLCYFVGSYDLAGLPVGISEVLCVGD